jgi:hypothetical protein
MPTFELQPTQDIRRQNLSVPVREYLDRLEAQLAIFYAKYGVTSTRELYAKIASGEMSKEDRNEFTDLFIDYRDAWKKRRVPERRLERGLEFSELIRSETEILTKFFNQDIRVPPLPESVTPELHEFWKENGYELHYLPPLDLQKVYQEKSAPGWKTPPQDDYFWSRIGNKKDRGISADAAKLKGG